MTNSKGARGKRRECCDAPAVGSGRGSAGDPNAGFGPNAGRVRGATAAPSSGARSGRGVAVVGGGTSGAATSDPAAAADGSHFSPDTAPSTLGNHGRSGAPCSMAGFPLDFSNCWDGGVGASLIPPSVRPQGWETYPRPPGGFMGYFHNQQQQSHSPNFHHVGAPSHLFPFKAPRPVDVIDDSPPVTPTQHPSTAEQQTVNVDSGDELVRTDKRIMWTPDEDERLVSFFMYILN
ncbi:hypothetical protein EJB05_38296, partial [Eragrostis curvula]